METTLAHPTVCWLTLLDTVGSNTFLTYTLHIYCQSGWNLVNEIYIQNADEHESFKKSAQGCKCTYISVCTWYRVVLTKYVPWHRVVLTKYVPWYHVVLTKYVPWHGVVLTKYVPWYYVILTKYVPWYCVVLTKYVPWYRVVQYAYYVTEYAISTLVTISKNNLALVTKKNRSGRRWTYKWAEDKYLINCSKYRCYNKCIQNKDDRTH